MSATVRATPHRRLPGSKPAPAAGGDAQLAVRRVATLVALALLLGLVAGPFAGILLFVAGLAALAAYAAAHSHHP
jgi:hypothetical protein